MNRITSNILMIVCIIICPIISLWANSLTQDDFHFERIFHQDQKSHFFNGGKLHDVVFNELTMLDNDGDSDLFSFVLKVVLTPQYFVYFLYAGLLLLFSLFFKRQLPFCNFLAVSSQHTYLAKRTLLI